MDCKHHPGREARVQCQKMKIGYCLDCLEDCMACTDPCGYCQFRQGCIIWEKCRRSQRRRELERLAAGGAA
jgi:hypothetical protein